MCNLVSKQQQKTNHPLKIPIHNYSDYYFILLSKLLTEAQAKDNGKSKEKNFQTFMWQLHTFLSYTAIIIIFFFIKSIRICKYGHKFRVAAYA